jgi:hypothetical protein
VVLQQSNEYRTLFSDFSCSHKGVFIMRALSLVRNTIALSALALGGSLTAASAQDVHYTAGTSTIDVAHSVLGDAIVGADALFNTSNPITGNPYNATVNVVTGGSSTAARSTSPVAPLPTA